MSGEIRELLRRPSRRSAGLVVAAVLVLGVPLCWSVRQSRLTREALDRAAAAERAAEQVRSDVEQTRARIGGERRPPLDTSIRRSAHADPRDADRVQQLQEEIEGLGQLREQIDQSLMIDRLYVPKELRPRRP